MAISSFEFKPVLTIFFDLEENLKIAWKVFDLLYL